MAKLSERVDELEDDMGIVKSEVDNLKGWQKTQNGSLLRQEAKMDRLIYLHFAELASVICFAWYMGRCLR